jgi:AcrR family transcriptional regulator
MESLPTRDALLAAGRRAFADRGYAGARLADIAADTGMTTGAFYRHFASKNDFFAAMFSDYGDDLLSAMGRARSLRGQLEAWLVAAREHRGVVRAAQELSRAGSPEAEMRRELRERASDLLVERLEPIVVAGHVRACADMVSDVVAQYVLMESAGWIPERDPRAVATELDRLVRKGLYKR